MPTQIIPTPVKACENCGAQMERKRYGKRLEDRSTFLRRRFCSLSCANTRTEVTKDALHWRARKHAKPECELCHTSVDLHVHHKDRDPSNNDPSNLQTLCVSCHLRLHWREDRTARMDAAKRAAATAARNGGHTRKRSADGRFC